MVYEKPVIEETGFPPGGILLPISIYPFDYLYSLTARQVFFGTT